MCPSLLDGVGLLELVLDEVEEEDYMCDRPILPINPVRQYSFFGYSVCGLLST